MNGTNLFFAGFGQEAGVILRGDFKGFLCIQVQVLHKGQVAPNRGTNLVFDCV